MSELPAGWALSTVGQVSERVVVGFVGPGKQFYTPNGVPFLMGKNVRAGHLDLSNLERVAPVFHAREKKSQLRANDVIVVRIGRSGEAAVIPEDFGPANCSGLVIVKQPRAVTSSYLCWYLNSPLGLKASRAEARGVTRQTLNTKKIEAAEVPVAPSAEQTRLIAKLQKVLQRIDACREKLERVPTILKRFREAVLEAAVSGRLTEEWRAAEGVSDAWVEATGSEVFAFVTSGSRGWAKFYADDGALFLRITNLDHTTIDLDLSDRQFVRPPKGAEGERTRVQIGDVLISITADVGMTGLVREDLGPAFINQHICLARPTEANLPAYLAYFLASPISGLGQLTAMQRGATKVGLTLGDIRNLTFALPARAEQAEIVRRIEDLFALADSLERKYLEAVERVEKLTPAVLAKAFRGELVPQDPEDEPASRLLERIRRQGEERLALRDPKCRAGSVGRARGQAKAGAAVKQKGPGGRRSRASSA